MAQRSTVKVVTTHLASLLRDTSTVSGGSAMTPSGFQRHRFQGLRDLGNDTLQINSDFSGASVFGNLSDATSDDGSDSIGGGSASAAYATGNGGNDTIYIAGNVLGNSVSLVVKATTHRSASFFLVLT